MLAEEVVALLVRARPHDVHLQTARVGFAVVVLLIALREELVLFYARVAVQERREGRA